MVRNYDTIAADFESLLRIGYTLDTLYDEWSASRGFLPLQFTYSSAYITILEGMEHLPRR